MTELLPIDARARRAKLSADDFDLLDRHGAFAAYRKTELIDGDIYFVNAQLRPHGMVKMELYDVLRDALKALGSPYRPVSEFTLALSSTDRPEPDIMLTSEPRGEGYVPAASVPLVIEVSDTTLRTDLGRKLRQYAKCGVPEYWVADVKGRIVYQMWSPVEKRYDHRREVKFGEPLVSIAVSKLEIATDNL